MERTIWFCDDEPILRRMLASQLRELEKETGDTFNLRAFSSGEELLEEYTPDIRIVLLDIEMDGGISGMDTARELRRISDDFFLVFITSHDEYALEGYEVQAFSFIKKPFIYEQLRRNMLLLFSKLDSSSQNEQLITLQGRKSSDVYRLDRIQYFEVFRHNTRVVTADSDETYSVSLSFVEEMISGSMQFYKCHKSYIVNFRYISRINGNDIEMRNGNHIPLSKHRRQDFLVAFARFSGGMI